MKKLFVASIAMVALSAGGSALAADCYGGGFVGYGWGKSQHRSADPRAVPGFNDLYSESDFDRVGDITPSFNLSGALGGFNVGCQYQFGWWLIGVEGDWAATNKDGQAFNLFKGHFDFTRPDLVHQFWVSQTTERWIATARLRLGWAAEKWLFFITGGAAWSGVDVTVWEPLAPVITAHHKRTLTGWTVGAGYEYALGYGWSLKSEFLYIDYGWTKFFDPADACSPDCRAFLNPREVSLKNYIFRTGLNWRFDWGKAPVAVMAKY